VNLVDVRFSQVEQTASAVRVNHAPALIGGTAIRSSPSHLGGCPTLYSGRLIKSRQCRRPAKSGHLLSMSHSISVVS